MSTPGYLEVLRRRPGYRRLWLGSVVSLLGDWFTLISLYSLLEETTGSGSAVGAMLLVRFLPAAVLGPIAGVVADRFPRRTILVTCDLLRAAVVLCFLFVQSAEQVWLVYLLTFFQMAAAAFFDPAEQASIASTVEPSELVTANTIQGITWSAMLGIGAVAGGVTTALVGRDASFVIDAVSYLASAAFISGAAVPFTPKTRATTWAAVLGFDDLKEGLARVRDDAVLRQAIWVKTAWAIPGGGAIVLYAILGERVFTTSGRASETAVGILLGMRGVGAFLGPSIARRVGGDQPAFLKQAIGVGFLVTAVFWLAFSFAPSLGLAALLLAGAHTGISTQWVFSTSLIATSVEDGMRGRIFSVDFMSHMLMLGLSSWTIGTLVDAQALGPRELMAVLSGLPLVTMFVWWLMGKPARGPALSPETRSAPRAS